MAREREREKDSNLSLLGWNDGVGNRIAAFLIFLERF